MSGSEKRQALRVTCSYPVRLYGQAREVTGLVVDVSRTGLRIQVRFADLSQADPGDMVAVAQAVSLLLGDGFLVDLHYEMLGPLIRKRIHLIRIGAVDVATGMLDLASRFEEPLRDEETMMLGVGLPPVGVTAPTAFKEVEGPKRRGHEEAGDAKPRPAAYEGILHPSEGHASPPLVGETHGVENESTVLSVPRSSLPGGASEMEDLVAAIRRQFGDNPRLEILDGLRMIWSGQAEVVEIDPSGDAVRLLVRTPGPGQE